MIRINKLHLDKFKYFRNTYNYMVDRGVWITFDSPGLDYIGINLFFLPKDMSEYERKADEVINKLIARDILEVID